jgi:serine protease Do
MKTLFAFMAFLIIAAPAFAQDSGWIGTSIADQADRGVLVRSVEANSPAEKAGLKANDVILQYNKQEVVGVRQLTRLVGETPVGRTVDVTVRRDNREQTLKVTAEKAPFPFGPGQIHIDTPNTNFSFNQSDFSSFRDHFGQNLGPVEVFTSMTATQAGIRTETLTPQLREFFGVQNGEGILVSSVDASSQASKAGLKAGDVIIAVDGKNVSRPQDLNREIRNNPPSFTLKVVRNKMERDIRVER